MTADTREAGPTSPAAQVARENPVAEHSVPEDSLPEQAAAPTLEDVAGRAGVSRSTASRAVNGGLKVSPQAQLAVEQAVLELSRTPNRAARSLVTRRTDSVALVVPEPDEKVLDDPYFAGTLRGLRTAFAETEIQLVLLIARREQETPRTIRYLRNGHTDGAIVVSHHRDDALATVLAESGRQVPADVKVVGFDDLGVATSTSPRLTTMRNPVVEVSRAAAELLMAQIAGRSTSFEPMIFDAQVVVRATA
jgi:DNA-binding LacI/PurR family transcriptional regulator